MAHVETVTIGRRVETLVRGRVYRHEQKQKRPEQSLGRRIEHAAKPRRRVCLLSARGADMLEQFGLSQPCFGKGCQHSHHTRDEIELLIASGTLRWVGRQKNVAAWRAADYLLPRMSGGVMKVVQVVAQ